MQHTPGRASLLSIVIPAYNEEAVLEQTLRTLLASVEAIGAPYEVIVVDDASTDRTAEIARSFGVAVVSINLRKISAVRNAGARAAQGEMLIFVDADTLVPPEALASAVEAFQQGAVGGGARVRMDEDIPFWALLLMAFASRALSRLRLAAGCFLFARRDTFYAVGGFDEEYFASEEIHLSRALKKKGRFVIISEVVVTSGRKIRLLSPRQLLWQLATMLGGGRAALKRRDGLELWYGGQREQVKHSQQRERSI